MELTFPAVLRLTIFFISQAALPEVSSADAQDAILDNFDQFIKLAGTELLDLKDVAHNITGRFSVNKPFNP